jgi:hypothetical protein
LKRFFEKDNQNMGKCIHESDKEGKRVNTVPIIKGTDIITCSCTGVGAKIEI